MIYHWLQSTQTESWRSMPIPPRTLRDLYALCALSSGVIAASGCKPDTGLKIHEDPPTVTILSPADADTFVEETEMALRVQLDDNDDGVESLEVQWRSDVSGSLDGEGELDGKTHTFVTSGLSLGPHNLIVEAIDPDGNTAEDAVLISMVANSAPQIVVTAPAVDSLWSDNDTVWVAVKVSDHEEPAAALRLSWTLDGVAVLDATSSSDEAGQAAHGFEDLSLGVHEVGVTVMDAQGATGTTSISWTVVYGDEDGDGYISDVVGGEDCDDNNADIHPDATEVCDEVDNDCDTLIDADDPSLEGGYVGHLDEDGDGFGATDELFSCEWGILIEDGSDCDDSNDAVHPDATEICDAIDNDCDGAIDQDDSDTDQDGDGHSVCENDCDDDDDAIHPDATEICDGIDNDCDGTIDGETAVDALTYYRDADGDSYGDADSPLRSCELPTGYTSDTSDCDDSNDEVNPIAEEICNEIDDDCDGLTDGDDPDTDDDGDGYSECEDDCDDDDATVSPDATEVCDEIDNDCDGTIDGETAVDAEAYYLDADGDGYGSMEETLLACSEPSGHVDDTTDCNDGDATIHPDAEEICGDGIDNDCDGVPGDCKWSGDVVLDEANHVTYGEDVVNYIGSSLALGDLDGDGIGDLMIGAHQVDETATNAGAVYLVPGPVLETWGSLSSHASARLDGVAYTDMAGQAIAVGDLDNDGQDDLVVGATQVDTVGSNGGATYIVYGPLTGDASLGDASATILAEDDGDYLGMGLHTGDLNGDGIADVAVGAEFADGYADEAGAAYLFMGGGSRMSGDISAEDADTRFYSTQDDMEFGANILFPGDVNGDGRDDLLISATRSDDGAESAGAVYLYLGHETLFESGTSMLHTVAQAEYLGQDPRDYAGTDLTALGDVDGDTRVEFAISAPYTDAEVDRDLGTVYLMLSPDLSGSSYLEDDADVRLYGSADDNALGYSIAGNFDLDADGNLDLVVSAPDERRSYTNQGVAYLLYGPLTDLPSDVTLGGEEDAAFLGEASSDHAGNVVLGGDVTDDGLDDLIITAPGMTPIDSMVDAGAAYVLFGGGM